MRGCVTWYGHGSLFPINWPKYSDNIPKASNQWPGFVDSYSHNVLNHSKWQFFNCYNPEWLKITEISTLLKGNFMCPNILESFSVEKIIHLFKNVGFFNCLWLHIYVFLFQNKPKNTPLTHQFGTCECIHVFATPLIRKIVKSRSALESSWAFEHLKKHSHY